jgi:hypothetical protein
VVDGTSAKVVLWAVIALAGAAVPATAQTTDPVFAGWRFSPATVGSRSAGMGGAFLAVADDARAAVTNPAGLTQVPVTEITFSTGRPWAAVATGRRRFRLAAYATKAEQEPAEPREGPERIALQPSITEFGVAAGLQLFKHVRVGAAVAHSRLSIEEEGRNAANGAQPLHPLVGSQEAQVRYTVGILVDLLHVNGGSTSPLRFAFAVQPGIDWSVPQAGGRSTSGDRASPRSAWAGARTTTGASPRRVTSSASRTSWRRCGATWATRRRRASSCLTRWSRASAGSTRRRSPAAAAA